jgi:phosphatidylglycerophosphate synthase
LPGKVSTAFQMAAILGALLEVPFAYRLTVVTVIITLISCADYLWSGSREALARTVTR